MASARARRIRRHRRNERKVAEKAAQQIETAIAAIVRARKNKVGKMHGRELSLDEARSVRAKLGVE